MSAPRPPAPAMLVLSALFCPEEGVWDEALPELLARFGPLVHDSGPLAFENTHYYDAELGSPIIRRLVGFERSIEQDTLPEAKLFTNALEARLARPDGRRRINLDPGLLSLERLVLATCKGFTHRIYLGKGIYADLTLIYQRSAWRAMPWTFPDYAEAGLQAHLSAMRTLYHRSRLAAPQQTDATCREA